MAPPNQTNMWISKSAWTGSTRQGRNECRIPAHLDDMAEGLKKPVRQMRSTDISTTQKIDEKPQTRTATMKECLEGSPNSGGIQVPVSFEEGIACSLPMFRGDYPKLDETY